MIAIDTSVFISYVRGEELAQLSSLSEALMGKKAWFPPAVITELLSNPRLDPSLKKQIQEIYVLEITDGYWQRAGALRAKVLQLGLKARLGDALIAQSCIDHDVPLLTTDKDFRHYAKAGGLKLAK